MKIEWRIIVELIEEWREEKKIRRKYSNERANEKIRRKIWEEKSKRKIPWLKREFSNFPWIPIG